MLDRTDITCNTSCDGHIAEIGPIGDREEFYRCYNLSRFGEIEGWRPLCNSDECLIDTPLYVDIQLPKERVTAAIVTNYTSAGVLIHSGLGPIEDDFAKGFIATALAIEEARTRLVDPVLLVGSITSHLGVFSVSMVPGAKRWVYIYPFGDLVAIDVLFTQNSYFEEIGGSGYEFDAYGRPYYYTWRHYSDIEDFELTRAVGGGDVLFETSERGVETVTAQKQLMEKIGWLGVGQSATSFLKVAEQVIGCPLPFAAYIGFIPMYLSVTAPPDSSTALGEHNWVNGIIVDSNDDDWCSSVMKCTIYLPYPGLAEYSFNFQLTSWISYERSDRPPEYRLVNLTYSSTLHFVTQ